MSFSPMYRVSNADGLIRVELAGQAALLPRDEARNLAFEVLRVAARNGPILGSPSEVAALVLPEMACLAQEHLAVVLLDTKNRVVRRRTVYVGTVDCTSVRAAEVLRPAVLANAPGLIVVHNHPSGDPEPSAQDIELTGRLYTAAELLHLRLHDHVIVGAQGYVSLGERGLLRGR